MALEFKSDGLAAFIGIFILVIVAIALIQPLADQTTSMGDLGVINSESITITAGLVETVHSPLDSIQAIYNLSEELIDLTAADFNYTALEFRDGQFHINASHVTADDMLINYTYQPSTYVEDSTSKTVLNATLILFFAVGILLFVIGWFMRNGIMDLFKKD